ncbi:MAG: mobilization protein, partial [Candidatus Macondimonas sp.]
MATIHFIGGEKGGVGKSLVARLLAQYLIDHNMPFLGFDSDRSHGALLRFYPTYASPVVIDRYESLDTVVEAATDDADRRIIVDLAAQTHQPLVQWMEESGM